MKTLAACGVVLLFAAGAFAQRINNSFGTNSGFGNVLFPAGKPTTGQPFTLPSPNFANVMGNVIAGRPPYTGTRGARSGVNRGGAVIYVPYAYPLIGGGYGYGYYGYGDGSGDVPPQQQPNITVVYPQQQPAPIIVMGTPPGQPADVPRSSIQEYNQPGDPTTASGQPDSSYYLLAFKDHSIYSAVGYWVDGDTLHYLTNGNVHNQISLSLVDRDLTLQLNKGRGVQINLPSGPSR